VPWRAISAFLTLLPYSTTVKLPSCSCYGGLIAQNSTHKHGPDHSCKSPCGNPFPTPAGQQTHSWPPRCPSCSSRRAGSTPWQRNLSHVQFCMMSMHIFFLHTNHPLCGYDQQASCAAAQQNSQVMDPWLCMISVVECGIYPTSFTQQHMTRTSQPLCKTTQTYPSSLQEKPHNNAASECYGMHTRIRVCEDRSW
jgi:hypothetical protein